MKVGIFYSSISNPKRFSNKTLLMDNFREGVFANGDRVVEVYNNEIPTDIDAGFILGYTTQKNSRRNIIDTLSSRNIPRIFVDSNILHYSKPEHEWHRYSVNSVYPNDGVYFFNHYDNNKWQRYSEWHNTSCKPWRETGNHILLLAQRPAGWNMFTDQASWIDSTIQSIRQYSHRPIVVRMHPGDGKRQQQADHIYAKYRNNNVTISTADNIKQDLDNCWASVGYNSTPNVVSAIEGVPVFVQDRVHSWATDVAFERLDAIEAPAMPDRSEWLQRIANIHWSNNEVKQGQLWKAIKSTIT